MAKGGANRVEPGMGGGRVRGLFEGGNLNSSEEGRENLTVPKKLSITVGSFMEDISNHSMLQDALEPTSNE